MHAAIPCSEEPASRFRLISRLHRFYHAYIQTFTSILPTLKKSDRDSMPDFFFFVKLSKHSSTSDFRKVTKILVIAACSLADNNGQGSDRNLIYR